MNQGPAALAPQRGASRTPPAGPSTRTRSKSGSGPGALRRCRVLAADAPRLLAGHPAVLYSGEGEPVGDVAGPAGGRVLVGASRAGRGFVPGGAVFPVGTAAFMVPRDHLRARYHRQDGPVDVLRARDAALRLPRLSGNPCELRMLAIDADMLPNYCPFCLNVVPRWREVPPGGSPGAPAGAELIPGPFCEIPAYAIARATAARDRYVVEHGGADRLVLAVSRAAFAEAVRAMEAVHARR